MPALIYRQPGLTLSQDAAPAEPLVRALQRDLRALGYLRRGIDGQFGPATARAVRALQHDLIHNAGRSTQRDGDAPIRVRDYNHGRVLAVTGAVDQPLVECISDLLDEPRFPRLPAAADPAAENRRVAQAIEALPSTTVPTAFLVAVLRQESGLMHYAVPTARDEDSFIVVGTDHGGPAPYVVTSRGYGAGQYTLFHHPPRPDEVEDFMLDPAKNVLRAARTLRDKLDNFVAGPADHAEDRLAERGNGHVTRCKYSPADRRYMRDCATCVAAAGVRDVRPGLPLYPGSRNAWQPTMYYTAASYARVPVRERLGCDWPYAVRRYNGGGINSYHYQARVLQHLARISATAAPAVATPVPR